MLRAVKGTLEAWRWTTYMVVFCFIGFFFFKIHALSLGFLGTWSG